MGEIILRDLVRHVGVERMHCVAVVSPKYKWRPAPDLAALAVDLLATSGLRARRWSQKQWGAAGSVLHHAFVFPREQARLLGAVSSLARQARIEQVFAVLDNPIMFGLAYKVAAAINVPLVSLVWDPPEYLARQSRFDRWSRRRLRSDFDRALAASRRVAVVSETMQTDYAAVTRAPIHILRHGLPASGSPAAAPVRPSRAEWIIGFAGSMYSNCSWKAFLAALDSVAWKVAGRPVRIRVLSARIELGSRSAARVEYLGFRSPEEAQALLADCDAFYMPQPFVGHLRDLCRYSFPTKLTNYLSLGKPVFVHAPAYGALAPFLRAHPVGVHADSLEASQIVGALERILADETLYATASQQARLVASEHFSELSFCAAVDGFLDS